MLIQQEFYPLSHIPKPAFQTTLNGKGQILNGIENRDFTLECTVNCATVNDRTLQSKSVMPFHTEYAVNIHLLLLIKGKPGHILDTRTIRVLHKINHFFKELFPYGY